MHKTNNAELTESINSMFQWYSDAALCLVYLCDYDNSASPSDRNAMLRGARWFKRGWTLQEIVASRTVHFYDHAWRCFGTQETLRDELASITGIDASFLSSQQQPGAVEIRDLLDALPVGRRMAWAAGRQTTKPEDMAYCLIGLFDVSMPMLYGEGAEKAFFRLQEEIIHNSNDLSLFAWTAVNGSSTYRGILARSPDEFASLGNLVLEQDLRFNPDYSMSNKGLRIVTFLKPTEDSEDVIMPLHCYTAEVQGNRKVHLGVILKPEGASSYVRARPQMLGKLIEPPSTTGGNSIFVAKYVRKVVATENREDNARGTLDSPSMTPVAFYFTIPSINAPIRSKYHKTVKLLEVEPRELWDAQNNAFLTRGLRSFTAFLKFRVASVSTGQVALICGFAENVSPWVLLDDQHGELFQATQHKDFQTMGEIGAIKPSLRNRSQAMRADQSTLLLGTLRLQFVSVQLRCDQAVHNEELTLKLDLEFH
ncbi:uncharacterized protein J4E87_007565 [Alternaria ethzedia]|uniref:uncharacterized protein n=1 Tax=Alternaria ethzedia TaxID=181014 RepID=UPI0020C2F76E|nr:uncharacterized protein J4E87_007565 [Alternaria ethzedia]KAI4619315.1 hypothetical protein J4E87_007565 [Alternaria ethzedia]